MAGLTTYAEAIVLNQLLSATGASAPYCALFSSAPTDAGGGTEMSFSGYARVALSFTAASGSPRQRANSSLVTFPANASGSTVTTTYFGVFDASSSGNLLGYAAFSSPVGILASQVAEFAIGALVISAD